ncbi:MAG: adaptor protein MecA [Clostridia bacterium]|nr:adaptor protein MecA [Clostridia bacterium]
MKLLRQGESGIRIRLTKEDLASYSMTVEDLDYDSARGKQVIWELFDKARQETGFDATGEKIYIQLYPTDRGGCDLFITKLEKEDVGACFYFSDFDNLYPALSRSPLSPSCKLWKDKTKGCFYAIVPECDAPPLFFEFGEKVKMPSHIFLRSRCQKVRREEGQSVWNNKKTR